MPNDNFLSILPNGPDHIIGSPLDNISGAHISQLDPSTKGNMGIAESLYHKEN